jgi:hypothetical protein
MANVLVQFTFGNYINSGRVRSYQSIDLITNDPIVEASGVHAYTGLYCLPLYCQNLRWKCWSFFLCNLTALDDDT